MRCVYVFGLRVCMCGVCMYVTCVYVCGVCERLWMCVCMCVCVYMWNVCMYVRCVCVCVVLRVHRYINTCVYIYTHIYLWTYVFTYSQARLWRCSHCVRQICVGVHLYVKYVDTCMYIFTCVYANICIYTDLYIHLYFEMPGDKATGVLKKQTHAYVYLASCHVNVCTLHTYTCVCVSIIMSCQRVYIVYIQRFWFRVAKMHRMASLYRAVFAKEP